MKSIFFRKFNKTVIEIKNWTKLDILWYNIMDCDHILRFGLRTAAETDGAVTVLKASA